MYGQFFVIFALILTGYALRKAGIISDAMNQSLNKFIVYFSFPCFIFHKVAGLDMSAGLMSEFLLAFVISVGLFLVFWAYAWGYGRLRHFPKETAGVAELLAVFPNNAFMGFPIAYIFFGEQGLLFMLANNIAMNLTIFSFGVLVLRRNEHDKGLSIRQLVKCVLNPNIIALALGLVFCLCKIGIPEMIDSYLVYVGSICTPMSMVFIGSTLVGNSIFSIIKDPVVMGSAINKNFVMPVIAYFILVFTPLPRMLVALVVFAACFPSAAVATVLVETEGKDSELACRILVASTAISIGSLPLAVKLINIFIL